MKLFMNKRTEALARDRKRLRQAAMEPSERFRAEIVLYAKSLLDAPYRWGGVEPYKGSHCATFVLAPYKMAGLVNDSVKIFAEHRDWLQRKDIDPLIFRKFILKFMEEIKFDDRQSGDLVTFIWGGMESHCGIIINVNPDWFIHSPSGGTVKFQKLMNATSLKSIYRHKTILELERNAE